MNLELELESESELELESDLGLDESELESDSRLDESELSKFHQNYLTYRIPKASHRPWVFWRDSEGCENNSSTADVGTPIIHDMIKSALCIINLYWWSLAQFWAPVTIDGRRLLSTSGQPFAVRSLSNELAKYRLNSEKYKYNIDDANTLDTESDDKMIKSGGPATAFMNRLTSMSKLRDDYGGLNFSVMLPLCFPSQSNYCIGVLEFTFVHSKGLLESIIFPMVKAIKDAGLDVFYVQHHIPYTTINGLKVAKDHIEEALKEVGESHDLDLAQVWIPYEEKSRVFLPSSLEETQTKQLLAIKLTGCYYTMKDGADNHFEPYFRFGDLTPRAIAEEFPLVTLQDLTSRFNSSFKFVSGVEIGNELDVPIEGDATGAELGDEIDLMAPSNVTRKTTPKAPEKGKNPMVVDLMAPSNVTSKTTPKAPEKGKNPMVVDLIAPSHVMRKTTPKAPEKGKNPMVVDLMAPSNVTRKTTPKAPEKGKNPMVVDLKAHSNVTGKTTPIVLPQEVIEKQFGKTMKEAAKNLNVHVSTLKRKFKQLGIPKWPGPKVKRNAIGSSIIQSNTNEEDNEAIQDPSTIGTNKDMLTVKANYGEEMIKFHIPILEATLTAVETKIVMQLKLTIGKFKLKYLDEDGAWISLVSEESMSECIKSLRNLNRNVVTLRVELYEQPTSPSSDSSATGTSSTFKGLLSL